jgi:hypothetical protein
MPSPATGFSAGRAAGEVVRKTAAAPEPAGGGGSKIRADAAVRLLKKLVVGVPLVFDLSPAEGLCHPAFPLGGGRPAVDARLLHHAGSAACVQRERPQSNKELFLSHMPIKVMKRRCHTQRHPSSRDAN